MAMAAMHERWDRQSAMMALIAQVNSGKNARIDASQFHPFERSRRGGGEPLTRKSQWNAFLPPNKRVDDDGNPLHPQREGK